MRSFDAGRDDNSTVITRLKACALTRSTKTVVEKALGRAFAGLRDNLATDSGCAGLNFRCACAADAPNNLGALQFLVQSRALRGGRVFGE